MNTDMKRRVFLKGSLAAGTVSVAVSAGLLAPQAALAAWPKAEFEAKKMGDLGAASGDINVKAPDIAENGAVVPVTVSHSMNADSVAIYASANGTPLVAQFMGQVHKSLSLLVSRWVRLVMLLLLLSQAAKCITRRSL